MKINSKNYHDYVFQNGKLIGEFEQMYKKSEGVPWHQDAANSKWYNKISIAVIERALEDESVKSIHEVACGYGYFLSNFEGKGRKLSGSDISPTAISKARKLFKDIRFGIDDIRREKDRLTYDLILISAFFWYVFPHIQAVVKNLAQMVRAGGYLFVGESFPSLDKDFVGKEVIPRPDKLIEWLSPYFETIIDGRVMKLEHPDDGPNLYWLGRRKAV